MNTEYTEERQQWREQERKRKKPLTTKKPLTIMWNESLSDVFSVCNSVHRFSVSLGVFHCIVWHHQQSNNEKNGYQTQITRCLYAWGEFTKIRRHTMNFDCNESGISIRLTRIRSARIGSTRIAANKNAVVFEMKL